jgi:hypothetical protein
MEQHRAREPLSHEVRGVHRLKRRLSGPQSYFDPPDAVWKLLRLTCPSRLCSARPCSSPPHGRHCLPRARVKRITKLLGALLVASYSADEFGGIVEDLLRGRADAGEVEKLLEALNPPPVLVTQDCRAAGMTAGFSGAPGTASAVCRYL